MALSNQADRGRAPVQNSVHQTSNGQLVRRTSMPHTSKPSLGVFVDQVASGLLVNSVAEGGLCDMYGLETGDVIVMVENKKNPTTEDLKAAAAGRHGRSMFTMQVASRNGIHYDFEFLVPLAEPETNFSGILFEQDYAAQLHVITGVLRGSVGAQAGVRIGSCIRMVDGVLCGGKTDGELRKQIFGGATDFLVLGLQPPQMTSLVEFRLPRRRYVETFTPQGDLGAGDDNSYCDGWSEKQFDTSSFPKITGWLAANLPSDIKEVIADAPGAHPYDLPPEMPKEPEASPPAPMRWKPAPEHTIEDQFVAEAPIIVSGDGKGGRKAAHNNIDKSLLAEIDTCLKSTVKEFLDTERLRFIHENFQVDAQVKSLKEGVDGMMGRLQSEQSLLDSERKAQDQLKSQIMRLQQSVALLLSDTV